MNWNIVLLRKPFKISWFKWQLNNTLKHIIASLFGKAYKPYIQLDLFPVRNKPVQEQSNESLSRVCQWLVRNVDALSCANSFRCWWSIFLVESVSNKLENFLLCFVAEVVLHNLGHLLFLNQVEECSWWKLFLQNNSF